MKNEEETVEFLKFFVNNFCFCPRTLKGERENTASTGCHQSVAEDDVEMSLSRGKCVG